MYVSPATLDMHLSVVERHFQMVHLDEWLLRARNGQTLPSQACALTFDDGWRDNFDHAFPVLRAHNAPATIFLVSQMIGSTKEFWPNRVARLISTLQPEERVPGRLGALLSQASTGDWDAQARDPEAIDRAIVVLKELNECEIDALLSEFQDNPRFAPATPSFLDDDQLRIMAKSELIRFGSHTRSHARFNIPRSAEVLRQEIAGSYADLRDRLASAAVPLFCYPNGDTSREAIAEVREHYIGAVTTRAGWHTPRANPYLMRRVAVHQDISGREAGFMARVSGWT